MIKCENGFLEIEEVKNKVQEQENELNRMANMFFKMLFSKDGE